MIPADGVLHVGRGDYVLAAADTGSGALTPRVPSGARGESATVWRVTEVRVGEVRNGRVEVIAGLRAGDRVIGLGAILLKPFVVQSVQDEAPPLPDTASPAGEGSAP
jgi:hypothetical protein